MSWFGNVVCFFKGHDHRVSEHWEGMVGPVKVHASFSECTRCGHKTKSITVLGKLTRDEARTILPNTEIPVREEPALAQAICDVLRMPQPDIVDKAQKKTRKEPKASGD